MNFEILLQLLFKNEQNLKKRIKSDLQSQNKIKYPEYKKNIKKITMSGYVCAATEAICYA